MHPNYDINSTVRRKEYMNHQDHITNGKIPMIHTNHTWDVNITPFERFGRVAIGIAGIVGGLILFASLHSFLVGILEVLLILAGIDMVVTGATGHCPLYKRLGHVPSSLRGKS
jgi:hypothetical protein